MAHCAICKTKILKNQDSYCPSCDACYCDTHQRSSGWKSVAAGIDDQYIMITCPKGHERREESYA